MHVVNSVSDPHPGSTEAWIADVVCEHMKLQPDIKRRRNISAEASAILESLFPEWSPISQQTKVCTICDNEHESTLQSLAESKAMAKKEKVRLHSPTSSMARLLISNLQSIFKSFDNQTRLSAAQLVIARGTDHFLIPRGTLTCLAASLIA